MSGVWISRALGLPDPRSFGSRNPGTTNILRTGAVMSTPAAVGTLIFDFLKGLIPTYLTLLYFQSHTLALLSGFIAVVGHIFPIFHSFNGGKGMATALGVMLAISIPLTCLNAVIWLVCYWLCRSAAVSSLVSVSTAPLLFLYSDELYRLSPAVMLISIFIIYKHCSNLYRLSSSAYSDYHDWIRQQSRRLARSSEQAKKI